MKRPSGIKFRKNSLLLIFCGLGVAAVTWWAAAAGPVQPKQALGTTRRAAAANSLAKPTYGSAASVMAEAPNSSSNVSNTGQAAGSPVQASQPASVQPSLPSVEPGPIYPVDPSPKCPYQPGSAQPDICAQCEAVPTPDGGYMRCNHCRSYPAGSEIACAL